MEIDLRTLLQNYGSRGSRILQSLGELEPVEVDRSIDVMTKWVSHRLTQPPHVISSPVSKFSSLPAFQQFGSSSPDQDGVYLSLQFDSLCSLGVLILLCVAIALCKQCVVQI